MAALVSTDPATIRLVEVMETNRRDSADDFDSFFRGVFAKTVAGAQRITGERASAEDAAVEALAKAHVRWKRIAGQPWREAWVYKVAVNEAIRRLPRPGAAVPVPAAGDQAGHQHVSICERPRPHPRTRVRRGGCPAKRLVVRRDSGHVPDRAAHRGDRGARRARRAELGTDAHS